MSDFLDDVGAATLLGTIGGLLHRRVEIYDVRPVISDQQGSHEIVALDVETEHGMFRVIAQPRE